MWSWFGGAAAQKRKDAPKNAILMLREQLDMLQKRERHLENQMEEQEAIAKKNVAANKTAVAKAALRRKKVHEKNLEQTTAQITQLEQQIYSIEAANINQETLNAMKAAGAAMTQIHGSMTIDKVDETMYVYSLGRRWGMIQGLIRIQGSTPRTTPTQRGNCPGYHQPVSWRTTRRGRVGCRTRRAGTGGHGRAYAQDRDGACGRPDQPVTRCCKWRAQGQNEASRGRRRGGRAREASCRNGHVMAHALVFDFPF